MVGTSSLAGSDAASDCVCNAGFGGPNGGPCLACEAGKFKATAGAGACGNCSAGELI